MIYGLLALIIAGLAFLSFQLYAQATKLDGRVMELEKRLSSTDESLNQSGAVMQVSIKELKERVLEQESQVAKLWVSAKKNQAAIEAEDQQANVLAQQVKAQGDQVSALTKTSDAVVGEIKVLKARAETISDIDAKVKEHAQTIAALKKQLAALEKENDSMSKKVEQSTGWIESNNAFRQQTNQSLNRLEQQIKNLQSGGGSTVNH
jgi:chromosome segregation ATPase